MNMSLYTKSPNTAVQLNAMHAEHIKKREFFHTGNVPVTVVQGVTILVFCNELA